MYTHKKVIGLIMLILISGVVCSTSHAEDAYAARIVNVSKDIPYDSWEDAVYKEIHDRQIENLTWGGIFNHSQEHHECYACEYVEKGIDSANALYKDVYGNQTNDNAERVNPKHSLRGNIRMSVTDANNNRIEDCLEGATMRAGIDADAEVNVIIIYYKKSSGPAYSVSYSTLNTLNTLGARVKYNYKIIDATALKMPAGNLNALAEVPGVEMIYLDREVHALPDTSVPAIRGDQACSMFGVSGADVTITVIDTGINASHELLDDPATDDDKVIAFEDFVNRQIDPYDDNGHGTHCAGIAAGTGWDSDYVGVAPISKLVGVKVPDQYGSGFESDCIAGIEVLGGDITFNNCLSSGFNVSIAGFSGEYSDFGTDTDGDGLYDYLTIEVGVNVTAAGNYKVCGELYDEYGSWVAYNDSGYMYLGVGSQSVPLEFSGVAIRQDEVNGTYNLTYLRLYDSGWNQLDFAYDAYTTHHYNYTEFQRLPAEFSNRYSDYGTDTDGNGLYDYLTIEIVVDVTTAGDYCVYGEFGASYGDYMECKSNCTYLNTGDQTIQLDFSGVAIGQDKVNGTYDLSYLCLYDSDWNQLDIIHDAYTTSHYNYTEFQRPLAEFSDHYSDYGTDTDGNGLYDYLTIEIGVDVPTSGYYCVDGELGYGHENYIGYRRNCTYLNTGDQTIELDFSGVTIRQDGFNGTYDLSYLRLYDSYQNQLDFAYDAYTTHHYNYTEFQRPPAEFSDRYSDHGTDTDGNGLYDYLTIEIGVNVTTAGYYCVDGGLGGSYEGSNHTYLNIGNQTVQLDFSGVAIRQDEVNGTYDLTYLCLYDDDQNLLDFADDAYTTSYYNYTEFGDSIPGAYLGDVNHDDAVTPADATIALKLAASGGWDPAADVNHDNQITSLDVLMILQAAADVITL
ncbi:MAG: Subtilisin-like serine protease [Candidatus Methanogaster sp.]|nr:MAG: Subtilisin-like serine protease [ANME-2 cluster archaeon]